MSPDTIQLLYRFVFGFIALGVLLGVVIEVASLIQAYVRRPSNIDAGSNAAGKAGDPAWPQYFARQLAVDYQDLMTYRERYFTRVYKAWRAALPLFAMTGPILLSLAGMVLIFSWIIVVTCRLALHTTARLAHWLLRSAVFLVDAVYALIKQSDPSCADCYHVMTRPAYVCPGCDTLHRDIRAGKLGALFRRCSCGQLLPTAVLRAAWQLDAVCQQCGAQVHRGAGVLKDVRVPVFGDPHAGKTRLMLAGAHSLTTRAHQAGMTADFPDERSRQRAENGLKQIADCEPTPKTQWQLEPALTCQLRVGTRGALVHLFDAAGERFRGSDGHDDLRYLDEGHTLVLVVDPFAIPALRRRLQSDLRMALSSSHLTHDGLRHPEGAYGEVVNRIRSSGVATERQRLAVAVTKSDLISRSGMTPPTDSAELRSWLYDNGLHNVVLAAEREFRETRYFAVASAGGHQLGDDFDPGAPLVWALTTRGVKLPSPPVPENEVVAK